MESTPTNPSAGKTRRNAVLAGVILIAFVAVLRLVVGFMLSPQSLVNRMEAAMNCRVEIGDIELSVFRLPCSITVHDVRIGERDDAANNAEKLGNRKPLERALLSASTIRLEGSPWELLSRKLDVTALVIDDAGADLRIRESGSFNVTKLFKEPDIIAGKPNPRKVSTPGIIGTPPGDDTTATADEKVLIEEVPFAASVRSMVFQNARVQVLMKKKGTRVDVSDLRFELSNLDVDPANLAEHNSGKVDISGKIHIARPEKNIEYAYLDIRGTGTIRPFDPSTRTLNPQVTASLTLQDPSEIIYLPSLRKIVKKLEPLKRFGIVLDDEISDSIQFADQTTVDIEYRDAVIRTLTPLAARNNTIGVTVEQGAYVHTGTNEHFFRVVMLGDQALSDRLHDQLMEKAKKILTGKKGEEFLQELIASFFTDGRFQPVCISHGDMGDPDVDLENKIPDWKAAALETVLDNLSDPEKQQELKKAGTKILEQLLMKKQ